MAASILAAVLAAAPSKAQDPPPYPELPLETEPAETAEPEPRPAVDAASLLDAADVSYQKDESGLIEVYYEFTDGRSQSVMIHEMEPIGAVPLFEVYSPVMPLDGGNLDASVSRRLLEISGSQKVGYFGLETIGGKWWILAYHNLPADALSPSALATTLEVVAGLADDAEKELRGAGVDEM